MVYKLWTGMFSNYDIGALLDLTESLPVYEEGKRREGSNQLYFHRGISEGIMLYDLTVTYPDNRDACFTAHFPSGDAKPAITVLEALSTIATGRISVEMSVDICNAWLCYFLGDGAILMEGTRERVSVPGIPPKLFKEFLASCV